MPLNMMKQVKCPMSPGSRSRNTAASITPIKTVHRISVLRTRHAHEIVWCRKSGNGRTRSRRKLSSALRPPKRTRDCANVFLTRIMTPWLGLVSRFGSVASSGGGGAMLGTSAYKTTSRPKAVSGQERNTATSEVAQKMATRLNVHYYHHLIVWVALSTSMGMSLSLGPTRRDAEKTGNSYGKQELVRRAMYVKSILNHTECVSVLAASVSPRGIAKTAVSDRINVIRAPCHSSQFRGSFGPSDGWGFSGISSQVKLYTTYKYDRDKAATITFQTATTSDSACNL
ncbi:hypothetical protein F4809DRAFT_665681 [Biscogniauxia mediterranea]|nr:hypothetical protein F4809DRAFT_665681 [Biscogniauxia mediterranea]